MNRRRFLRSIGVGAAAVVAPVMLASGGDWANARGVPSATDTVECVAKPEPVLFVGGPLHGQVRAWRATDNYPRDLVLPMPDTEAGTDVTHYARHDLGPYAVRPFAVARKLSSADPDDATYPLLRDRTYIHRGAYAQCRHFAGDRDDAKTQAAIHDQEGFKRWVRRWIVPAARKGE